MKKIKTVDEYIKNAPKDVQGRLKQIREAIIKIAPEAKEKISYGMPYYVCKRRLAYFAFAKNHIGLYIPPPVIENHREELKNYHTAISTVQFPLKVKLPIGLIRKLIKARVKINNPKK